MIWKLFWFMILGETGGSVVSSCGRDSITEGVGNGCDRGGDSGSGTGISGVVFQ